jgi:uncharacterized protein (DUF302 family)
MIVQKVEVERVTLISAKPFEAVVGALEEAVGRPDVGALLKAAREARTVAELERAIQPGLGPTGLMLFMKFDQGEVLRKEPGLETAKVVRLLIGNPLIMKDMVRHIPDAGSYVPITILVDQRRDGVHVSYDRMASVLARYGNVEALAVARTLDEKVESLLRACAG